MEFWQQIQNLDPMQTAIQAGWVLALALVALFSNWAGKKYILPIFSKLVKKSATEWDDVLLEEGVFRRISHIVPALVVHYLAPLLVTAPGIVALIKLAIEIYIIAVLIVIVFALLDSLYELYNRKTGDRDQRNAMVRSPLQVLKVVVFLFGAIVIVAKVTNQSPWGILGGLWALAAVIMFVFKDILLGFTSGIILMLNDMVRVGDWIEMPKYGADGDVTKITMTTVVVKNWDKTDSYIPAYALVSSWFRNWRGMQSWGARRIKKNLPINMHTTAFLTDDEIERFKKVRLISGYISEKQAELEEDRRKLEEAGFSTSEVLNGRRMSRLGTFREYVKAYLRDLDTIAQQHIVLVRLLEPTPEGVPLQVYAFTETTDWIPHEAVTSNLFEHLLAAAKEFGLEVFQSPSGTDFKRLSPKAD